MDASFLEIFTSFGAALVISLLVAVVLLYPLWRCLSRAGFAPAWSLIILIPFLWPVTITAVGGMLAFGNWPALAGAAPATSWKALSSNRWVDLTREEAAQAELYGLGGWLLVILIVSICSAPIVIWQHYSPDGLQSYQDSYGLGAEHAIYLSYISIFINLLFIICLPVKRHWVPATLVVALWIDLLIIGGLILAYGTVSLTVLTSATIILSSVLLYTWYFLQSKRVNLTYRTRVPAPLDPETYQAGG